MDLKPNMSSQIQREVETVSTRQDKKGMTGRKFNLNQAQLALILITRRQSTMKKEAKKRFSKHEKKEEFS
jgi:hypothetical protein